MRAALVSQAVWIRQVACSDYALFVWPCALVLAQHIWGLRTELQGKRVLELGAG
jgi:predicted nicotinamide N-methyase